MEPPSVAAMGPRRGAETKPLDEPRIRRWMVRQCAGADPVLDVGCGAGELCADLSRRGHRVTGVDLDPTQLAAASRMAPPDGMHPAPEWLQDDGQALGRLVQRLRFGAATRSHRRDRRGLHAQLPPLADASKRQHTVRPTRQIDEILHRRDGAEVRSVHLT